MSLIKGKREFRTILDFSKGKITKNMVKRELRNAEVCEVTQLPGSNSFTFIENGIRVGMYQIQLVFPYLDANRNRTRLKEYGSFRIAIFERGSKGKTLRNISLTNKLFAQQYWVPLNKDYGLRMKNLVDIIMFVKRLDNLKLFL